MKKITTALVFVFSLLALIGCKPSDPNVVKKEYLTYEKLPDSLSEDRFIHRKSTKLSKNFADYPDVRVNDYTGQAQQEENHQLLDLFRRVDLEKWLDNRESLLDNDEVMAEKTLDHLETLYGYSAIDYEYARQLLDHDQEREDFMKRSEVLMNEIYYIYLERIGKEVVE